MQLALVIFLFIAAFFLLSAVTLAPVVALMVHATQRFRRTTREVLPGFAQAHGLTLEPTGAPDRLPRASGSYRGRPIEVEVWLKVVARALRWDDHGDTVQTSMRVRVYGAKPDAPALSIPLGRGHEASGLDEPAATLARAFGQRRRGRIVRADGVVRLEWPAEEELEVLTLAADLCVALADAQLS